MSQPIGGTGGGIPIQPLPNLPIPRLVGVPPRAMGPLQTFMAIQNFRDATDGFSNSMLFTPMTMESMSGGAGDPARRTYLLQFPQNRSVLFTVPTDPNQPIHFRMGSWQNIPPAPPN